MVLEKLVCEINFRLAVILRYRSGQAIGERRFIAVMDARR